MNASETITTEGDEPRVRLEGRYVEADAHRIYELSAGPRQAQTFVFIHGIGASFRYFLPLIGQLGRNYRVLAIDLPGFGRSSRPEGAVDMEGYAVIVERYLEAADIRSPVLVGHSMGCQIAVRVLARGKAGTRGGVLIGPTVDPSARSLVRQGARLLEDGLREPPQLNGLIIRDYLRAGVRRYAATARRMVADRIEEGLPRCSGRVLVVRGEYDPIVPAPWAREAAELLPQGELREVGGAAHVAQWTHPAEVAGICAELVEGA